jgi:hypothetical protein
MWWLICTISYFSPNARQAKTQQFTVLFSFDWHPAEKSTTKWLLCRIFVFFHGTLRRENTTKWMHYKLI